MQQKYEHIKKFCVRFNKIFQQYLYKNITEWSSDVEEWFFLFASCPAITFPCGPNYLPTEEADLLLTVQGWRVLARPDGGRERWIPQKFVQSVK